LKVRADCAPCLINRALSALDKSGISEEAKFSAMEILVQSLASRYNEKAVPAFLEKEDMDFIKAFTGCTDPYAEVKSKAYLIAKKVIERVVVDYSTWSEQNLRRLMELAVAANGLEFDVKGYEFDASSLERPSPLAIDDTHDLWMQAASSKVVAYVLDNVGEHVFDLMVAKYLSMRMEVHVYAKSAPLLNDVARDELSRALIPPVRAHYYEPRAIGITWDDFDDEYDFVVAKGMANYETLTEGKPLFPVYHALKVKCRPMALSLGAPLFSGVVRRRR